MYSTRKNDPDDVIKIRTSTTIADAPCTAVVVKRHENNGDIYLLYLDQQKLFFGRFPWFP